jgi:hypothetical protein
VRVQGGRFGRETEIAEEREREVFCTRKYIKKKRGKVPLTDSFLHFLEEDPAYAFSLPPLDIQ